MTSSAGIPEAGQRLIDALRKRGVADERVLAAMAAVPRQRFVPAELQEQAWADTALPIGKGQTISQPFIVAVMTEALQLGERDRALEVGTGSGYQAAILAHLCRRVYTIERMRSLLDDARAIFDALGLHNIHSRCGDGTKGWPEAAPFDAVIATAAVQHADAPDALVEQLAPGGRMVLPLTLGGMEQYVYRLTRPADGGAVTYEALWPVRFVPLVPGEGARGDT